MRMLSSSWTRTVPLLLLMLSRISAFDIVSLSSRRFHQPSTTTTRLCAELSLTAEQQHALEVFENFDSDHDGTISPLGLRYMLKSLDIDANPDEAEALFKYLDSDNDGSVDFDDFLPWYTDTAAAAKEVASNFQSLLIGRRTIDLFDQTPVSDDVLRRAVQCAIAAPNRSLSEPWRFIQVGPETVAQFELLKEAKMETGKETLVDWTQIPGWCVVTTKVTPDDPIAEMDDFKSTCCAVQNFMLSMWSEGIGTKWTSGPIQKTEEFAKLCGVDLETERVAGCIWYGFATGGLVSADPRRRKKNVQDVLSKLP